MRQFRSNEVATQTFITYYDPAAGANVTASQITPGYYNGFPPKKFNGVDVKNTIVMEPGIYCVNSVLKQISNPVHIYGDDVTIYVRSGNDILVNGGVCNYAQPMGMALHMRPMEIRMKIIRATCSLLRLIIVVH